MTEISMIYDRLNHILKCHLCHFCICLFTVPAWIAVSEFKQIR